MGISIGNIEPQPHGQDTTGAPIPWPIRFHLGDDNVDETHTMTEAVRGVLMKLKWKDNDKTGFLSDFEDFVDSVGSAGAKAIKAKLARAAYRCF